MAGAGRHVLAVFLCCGIAVLAFAAGRRSSGVQKPLRASELPHGLEQGTVVPPQRKEAAPIENRGDDWLEERLAELRASCRTGEIDRINDLQRELATSYSNGRITLSHLLSRVESEEDVAVLDLLCSTLRSDPSRTGDEEVVQSFLRLARRPGHGGRQRVALAFLAGIPDSSGLILNALVDVMRTDADPDVRGTSIAALAEYASKNAQRSPSVRGALEPCLRDPSPVIRAAAVRSFPIVYPSADELHSILVLGNDSEMEVRVAVYEKLGDVRGECRGGTLEWIGNRISTEHDAVVQSVLLTSLVRVGRGDALPWLRRMESMEPAIRGEVKGFIRALELGELDWDRILERKAEFQGE